MTGIARKRELTASSDRIIARHVTQLNQYHISERTRLEIAQKCDRVKRRLEMTLPIQQARQM